MAPRRPRYDNEMADRSTAAMEEGVRHSARLLLFLSGDPEPWALKTFRRPLLYFISVFPYKI